MSASRSVRVCVLLAALSLVAASSPQDTRQPVPEPAAQAQLEKTVRDLFKDEYARKSAQDVAALAKKLLQQGLQTSDDPVARYVLLREARDLAAQAGDIVTAMAAIDELGKAFVLDPIDMTSSALTTAVKASKTPEALEAITNGYLSLVEKMIAVDRYDDAGTTLGKAENPAKAAQNVPLVMRIQAQKKDVVELQKEYQRVKTAEKTLAENPDDSGACLALGRFLCLMKRDWARGLPLLAKGSDSVLQTIAQRDLANPPAPAGQIEVGDGWWEVADKQKDAISKKKFLARAKTWYELGVQGTTGLSRAKVEKRLEDLEQLSASGPIVDVLALIDPKKDALGGAWEKNGPALLSPTAVAQASLQIPYIPPVEYDLKLIVERKDIHVLHIGLPSGDVRIDADVDNQSTWGNLNFTDTPTKKCIVKYNTSYIPRGKISSIVCTVRRMGVTITIDGKVVLCYEGDINNAKPVPEWKPPNPKALSLGSWGGWVFTKISLVPVSGQGKKLRP